jgi:hypothetical protein
MEDMLVCFHVEYLAGMQLTNILNVSYEWLKMGGINTVQLVQPYPATSWCM